MSRTRIVCGAPLDIVGVALLVAGPVMVIRGSGGRKEIRTELAAQKITFPDGDGLPNDLTAFAGRQVETGPQARAYSDLIKNHLARATGGRTYSEISAELAAVDGDDHRRQKLSDLQRTAFMGETLRASLMSAYQAWHLTTLVTGLGALVTGLGAALLGAGDGFGRPRRDG